MCGLRFFLDEARAHIRHVAVQPLKRRAGVAEALVSDALRIAKFMGLSRVTLNVYGSNTGAIRLYEKKGFEIVGARAAPEDVSRISHIMALSLECRDL